MFLFTLDLFHLSVSAMIISSYGTLSNALVSSNASKSSIDVLSELDALPNLIFLIAALISGGLEKLHFIT